MAFRVVRITKTAADNEVYETAFDAQDAKLAKPVGPHGVSYGVQHLTAPIAPSDVFYIVAWSGGYEAPSYAFKATEDAAWDQAREWAADIKPDDGDYIDVLRVDPVLGTVERIEVAAREPGPIR